MNRCTSTRLRRRLTLGMAALVAMNAAAVAAASSPQPVLMVIANQDFYYAEYAAVRASLEARNLPVSVAAGDTQPAQPQGLGRGSPVQPDRALADVRAADYSAIVFVGGWGASSYQYAFEGTYHNSAYRPQRGVVRAVNNLINDFVAQDKPVAALNHGVTVLAWARVDGVSPLRGRLVVGPAGGMPGFRASFSDYADGEMAMRWQVDANGALMLNSGSVGDPLSSTDDVVVDGRIITAEDYGAAGRFAEAMAQALAASPN